MLEVVGRHAFGGGIDDPVFADTKGKTPWMVKNVMILSLFYSRIRAYNERTRREDAYAETY